MAHLTPPFALYVGSVDHPGVAKTAMGIAQWRREDCSGQLRSHNKAVDLGLPDLDIATISAHARSLIIGVAPRGGVLPEDWIDDLCQAALQGVDIASGLHQKLNAVPRLVEAAQKSGAQLWDVRVPPSDLPVGNGVKRTGRRILTVGTDCVAGKKYTALAVSAELKRRGLNCDFRATGQTGIMIAGSGIPIDAVVSDFISGAAELVSPGNTPDHLDVIEGQGALGHPSYAGVALGLLHGSQPDGIILCHNAARKSILGLENYPVPSVAETIERNLEAGQLTNAEIRCVGISVNPAGLTPEEFGSLKQRLSDETGLPCVDPLQDGPGAIADYIEAVFS
ncbi:MAG: DUF1611 domain-containing protein [Pseudomonadota bacterium]